MNPDPSPLRQQQQQAEQESQAEAAQQGTAPREFNSVEEIIQLDLQQTTAPEWIAERLKESIAREPPRPRSWWERLFGRKARE